MIHLSRQVSRENTRELFLFQKIKQQEEPGKISHPNPRDPAWALIAWVKVVEKDFEQG